MRRNNKTTRFTQTAKKTMPLLLVGILSLAPACGSDKGKTQSAPLPPVELVFYDGSGDWQPDQFDKEIAQPLQTKYPHLVPKFIPYTNAGKMQELITAGETPDIIYVSTGLVYDHVIKYELQTDITDLIKKNNYDMGKIEPAAVNMMKQLGNGQIYGLPAFMAPSPLYYNKDIFDKFGVAYPKNDASWDDLYDLAKRLTRKDGDQQYYGFMLSPSHLAVRNQLSLPLIDPATETASFADDRWKPFFENFIRFYQIPGYVMDATTADTTNQRNKFTKDRTVAMWLPVSTLHTASELQGMNWDMATFPTYKGMPGVGPQPYPVSFYITKTSKHKDQAFQAISYIATEEYQLPIVKKGIFHTALKSEPLRNAFGQEADMYKGKNTKAMLPQNYSPGAPLTKYNNVSRDRLYVAYLEVVRGLKDLNTALRDAEEKTNQKIKELKTADAK
ncbi:ABC transporter substrate-binding protein [Paenibacillus ginsengarvi]|uniref:Extracellular solute-binding protein n=1 Tax=Paenibacillus ginsengarvi TaxID=400777 RepID=A0A3B0C0Z4_9BACL|nr:extracellular solute-binding protein [Paenibacillus ginsengarvi]RKN79072.1 extracellular solute-binding protein [Paenibacillus ginsengarvi]